MDASPWTLWTARISFLLYVLAIALRLTRRDRTARFVWSTAFAAFACHMIAAFEFEHHWSHADAYDSTARKTDALTGLDWGGGLYANYAVAIVWLVDVLWWLMRPSNYLHRPAAIEGIVQGFLAFLWFNATVVFGHGPIQPLGAVAFLGLAILGVARLRRKKEPDHGTDAPVPRA